MLSDAVAVFVQPIQPDRRRRVSGDARLDLGKACAGSLPLTLQARDLPFQQIGWEVGVHVGEAAHEACLLSV